MCVTCNTYGAWLITLKVLEERFEAQAATLRLAKEQCGDLQVQLALLGLLFLQ